MGGRRPRHFHAEPELNILVCGSAVFGIGESRVELSAGELIVFPAGQDHVLLDSSSDLYLFAAGMVPELSLDILGRTTNGCVVPTQARLSPERFRAVVRHAEQAVDKIGGEAECSELWEHAHSALRSNGVSSSKPHVLTRRVLQVLSQAPELALGRLSAEMKSSESELSRHVHRDLGMTFVRYRTRLRLLNFIQQVDRGQRNWLHCAQDAGFGSYSQAHRAFRAELGCTPRAFFSQGRREQMHQEYSDSTPSSAAPRLSNGSPSLSNGSPSLSNGSLSLSNGSLSLSNGTAPSP
jgi:AraC-like DNA-binding protein